ncbi:histidine kinase [Saprospiraceae bacterium]|nr:histidine kinase [Saprospiraceae bacterium]
MKKFGVKEGLPTNFIYRAIQDRRGNLWICTMKGISKYDGYSFTNFSVKDGLPDNDVFNLTEDYQNRLWIINNRNKIAYIKDNKIVNFDLRGNGRISVVDRKKEYTDLYNHKNILRFYANDSLIILPKETLINDKNSSRKFDFKSRKESELFSILSTNYTARETFVYKNMFFQLGNSARDSLKIINKDGKIHEVLYFENLPKTKASPQIIYLDEFNSEIQTSSSNFLAVYDSSFSKISEHEIPFESVPEINSIFKDITGNIWISTIRGIYFLDKSFLNQSVLYNSVVKDLDITAVESLKDGKVLCTSANSIYFLKNDQLELIHFTSNESTKQSINSMKVHNSSIYITEQYTGIKEFMHLNEGRFKQKDFQNDIFTNIDDIKDLTENNDLFPIRVVKKFSFNREGKFFFSSRNNFFSLDLKTKTLTRLLARHVEDFVINNKTCVLINNDDLYVFESNALTEIHPEIPNPKEIHFLTDEILLIYSEKEQSYVSNLKIAKEITFLKGIPIKKIVSDRDIVWILHENGIFKTKLSSKNDLKLLASYDIKKSLDVISLNTFFFEDSIFAIATDEGLFNIDIAKWKTQKTELPIYIDSISTSNQTYKVGSKLIFPYKENDIVIHTTAISLSKINNIEYHYRLKAAEEEFIKTTSQEIRYPNLGSGNYEFEIYATDNQVGESEVISIKITIRKPWYNTFLFYGLCIAGITAILYYFYKRREKQLLEKALSNQKFAELELNALQSQMNPHFVFNAMGSLQNLVQNNEQELADRYIAKFAKLMRMFLESSKSKFITLTKELQIVEAYFELEKLRFGDKINLLLTNGLDDFDMQQQIPASLIQPFVENAINHGLFHKAGAGLLQVNLQKNSETILISIRDNGIGREAAGAFKKKSGNHNPSRALQIITDKISAIQKLEGTNINYDIVDLTKDGKAAGTEIIISISIICD